jgi:ferric-dicitrate binding protein FerR (iron transport regulator)
MEWGADTIATIAAAVLAFLGAVLSGRRRSGVRDEVEQDIRIAAALPKGSAAREAIERSVEERATDLARSTAKRRHWGGAGLGLLFVGVAVMLFVAALRGGWWNIAWLGVLFFGFFGIYGFFEGLGKAHRDVGGRRIQRHHSE